MNLKRNICLAVHQGMGDHIIINGLVRQLAREYDMVVVPVKANNYESVGYMYRDVPNVVVRYVLDDEDQAFFVNEVWKGGTLKFGLHWNDPFDASVFDQEFYHRAGMSFQLRWDNFHVERAPEQEVNINSFVTCKNQYSFVHEDYARGFKIERRTAYPRISADTKLSKNIFAWIPLIENATEVHCINSSFALLIDSLPRIEDQPLFLHRYARKGGEVPTFRHDWIMID